MRSLVEIVNSQEKVTAEEVNAVLEDVFDNRRVDPRIDHMLHNGIRIPHEMVVAKLGEKPARAYSYMFPLLGSKRRRCGNPKMRHAYDAAWYGKQFLGGEEEVAEGMLHDIIEETSKTLGDTCVMFAEQKASFGEDIATRVSILTNPYEILVNELKSHFQVKYAATKDDLLLSIEERMGESLTNQLREYIGDTTAAIRNLNFNRINKKREKNEKYDVFEELERKLFPYFIRSMVKDAKQRYESGDQNYDSVIRVRLCEQIDNARTLSPEPPEADDTIYKMKTQMPIFEEFQQWLEAQEVVNNRLTLLMYALKLNMVESLYEREQAIASFRDTAYRPIRRYFNKYKKEFMKRFGIGYDGQKFMVAKK